MWWRERKSTSDPVPYPDVGKIKHLEWIFFREEQKRRQFLCKAYEGNAEKKLQSRCVGADEGRQKGERAVGNEWKCEYVF